MHYAVTTNVYNWCGIWLTDCVINYLPQLEKRVTFHEHLLPVCLPHANFHLKPNKNCTVIGWGKRKDEDGNRDVDFVARCFAHLVTFCSRLRAGDKRGGSPSGGKNNVQQLAGGKQGQCNRNYDLRWPTRRWKRRMSGKFVLIITKSRKRYF